MSPGVAHFIDRSIKWVTDDDGKGLGRVSSQVPEASRQGKGRPRQSRGRRRRTFSDGVLRWMIKFHVPLQGLCFTVQLLSDERVASSGFPFAFIFTVKDFFETGDGDRNCPHFRVPVQA